MPRRPCDWAPARVVHTWILSPSTTALPSGDQVTTDAFGAVTGAGAPGRAGAAGVAGALTTTPGFGLAGGTGCIGTGIHVLIPSTRFRASLTRSIASCTCFLVVASLSLSSAR